MSKKSLEGKIIRISGPVIEADNLRGAKMYDVVRVGEENLIGEIIRLNEDVATSFQILWQGLWYHTWSDSA